MVMIFCPATIALAQEFIPPEALTPDPDLIYAVTGITAGDRLGVGYRPGAGATAVASLAHDTRGILVTGRRIMDGHSAWWEVITPGAPAGTGWVGHINLTIDAPAEHDPGPYPLLCAGTEPVWSMRLEDKLAVYIEPGEMPDALTAGGWMRSRNDGAVFVIQLRDVDRPAAEDEGYATLRKTSCAMSFHGMEYPFEATVIMPERTVLSGCCSRLAVP